MGIAGHVSRKMLEHYSHARMAAKRVALAALGGKTESGHALDTFQENEEERPLVSN
jgi:hypothetical protein